jgi:hypothetical protein
MVEALLDLAVKINSSRNYVIPPETSTPQACFKQPPKIDNPSKFHKSKIHGQTKDQAVFPQPALGR